MHAVTCRRIAVSVLLSFPCCSTAFAPQFPSASDLAREVFRECLVHVERTQGQGSLDALARWVGERTETLVPAGASGSEARRLRRQFLLGLCAAFDHTGVLERHPLTRPFFEDLRIGPEERELRRRIGDWFTVHGRADAARHFFLSAFLAGIAGPVVADRLGRYKEMDDSLELGRSAGSEGFSFHDLAYDIAGIRYACWMVGFGDTDRLYRSPPSLHAFLGPFEDVELPRGLDWATFRSQYMGERWGRFTERIEAIHSSIDRALERAGAGPRSHPGRR